MENMEFNLESLEIVVAGSKNIQSTPIVSVKPTMNHFVINMVAADMMGLKIEDYVTMVYAPGDNGDRRFFITKAIESEKGARLGKAGSSLGFNYAGIFGSAYLDDAKRKHVSIDELIEKGLFHVNTTEGGAKSKRGIMNVHYGIESLGMVKLNGEVREVFALVNRKESLVNPNEVDSDETIENDLDMDNQESPMQMED